MNWAVIQATLPTFIEATLLTVRVAAFGIVGALIVGILCATITRAKLPVARQLVWVYVEISRNTPLLGQLFFLYYGLPKLGIVVDAEHCAVIGLTFLGGSFMAEALRSGLDAVEPIQWQSAQSLGLSGVQTMRHVILPQATAIAMPALTANVIFLIKETSVVSIIALADLVFVAKEQIGSDYTTAEALFLLVSCYLVILLPVSLGAGWLERRLRHATFGD